MFGVLKPYFCTKKLISMKRRCYIRTYFCVVSVHNPQGFVLMNICVRVFSAYSSLQRLLYCCYVLLLHYCFSTVYLVFLYSKICIVILLYLLHRFSYVVMSVHLKEYCLRQLLKTLTVLFMEQQRRRFIGMYTNLLSAQSFILCSYKITSQVYVQEKFYAYIF